MSRKGYFIGGVILGTVLGAIAGLILAPTSGEETRKKIKKIANMNEAFIQDAKEKTEVVVHKTIDAIKQGIDKLGKLVDDKKASYSSEPDSDPDNSEAAA